MVMGQSPVTRAQVFANIARHELMSRYDQWDTALPGIGRTIGRVSEARFEGTFDDYSDDVIFVHAGLGAVKRAFSRDPYAYLRDVLLEHFESVLVPGFTPSFRSSGVYHKAYSRPEYGAFARQFLTDAEYRTDDAIHSILVHGPYRFNSANHRVTFGGEGCFAQLDEDNVLYCNVGTPWIVSTQHHFIEHAMDVPYNTVVDHEGVIYHTPTEFESCKQQSYTYQFPARRAAAKIQSDLRDAGILTHVEMSGLTMNFFRAGELRRALEPKIRRDPYYLIR